ncbi:thiamine pyrophosphate-dependent enzyme, partial [Enterococcus faecium]|uniref:thiamine pyrophosphate-dependent enzyme n=1 Tax=Enterococcus faecium TaxID=1352 RepID=UPI003AADD8E4
TPTDARSSVYATDVAKTIQAPILHVNGDDPEACVHVAQIATEFRQIFGRDVVIDMFCYRRHGHNETDEPAFTQPLMYREIARHQTTRQLYARRLVEQGVIGEADAERMIEDYNALLETEFQATQSFRPNNAGWLEGRWSGLSIADDKDDRRGKTDVSME